MHLKSTSATATLIVSAVTPLPNAVDGAPVGDVLAAEVLVVLPPFDESLLSLPPHAASTNAPAIAIATNRLMAPPVAGLLPPRSLAPSRTVRGCTTGRSHATTPSPSPRSPGRPATSCRWRP